MEPQLELMTNVKKEIEKNITGLKLSLIELSNDDKIYMELGAGFTEKKYVRGPGIYVYPVLFIAKRPGKNESDNIEKLSKICNFYKTHKTADGKLYKARANDVTAEPNKIGRQEDGQTLYSCVINFKISY